MVAMTLLKIFKGQFMYFLLSPAKALNETKDWPEAINDHLSQPILADQAASLMQTLKQKDPIDLQELMGISSKIAELNASRNQGWQLPFDSNNAKPAIYLFDGDAYRGLDSPTLDLEAVHYLNSRLGILSGLYGLIQPLDLIAPYRLEMGTALATDTAKDLYEFWGEGITELINRRWQDSLSDNVLVNLASNEYFKAVNAKQICTKIITPRFEDYKNGQYKVISFYAKKARGMMARFAAMNQLTDVEALKTFNLDGYYYCESASNDKTWTFRRDEI